MSVRARLRFLRPLRRAGARLSGAAMAAVTGTITHVATRDPVAALTFDDGPHPMWTPRLLGILEAHGARGTFFMLGKAAQRLPEIVRRVAQGGHAIGNHSWDHPSFPLIASRDRQAQLRACERAVAPYGQRLFRPPYGHDSIASRIDTLRLGYRVLTWSMSSDDWRNRDATLIAREVMSDIRPGSVIVFHDALFDALDDEHFDRGPTVEAVHLLLSGLRGRLRFVTIPELLQHGVPQRATSFRQADAALLRRLTRREQATESGADSGDAARHRVAQ